MTRVAAINCVPRQLLDARSFNRYLRRPNLPIRTAASNLQGRTASAFPFSRNTTRVGRWTSVIAWTRSSLGATVRLKSEELYPLLIHEMEAVYRLAQHLVSNASDAEDLTQETFYRAFRSADRFTMTDFGPRPWLFRILHNLISSHYTSKSREAKYIAGIGPLPAERSASTIAELTLGQTFAPINWDDVDEQLKRALDTLPLQARMTFLLHAVEGLRYREIAQVMEVPIGTVMSRLSRTRLALAAQLNEFAAGEGWKSKKNRKFKQGQTCSETSPIEPDTLSYQTPEKQDEVSDG